MRLIVYVDVLIVLNFIVNYLLLAVSARLCAGSCARWRLALAALIGAAASLCLFLPPGPGWVNAAFKLGLSALLAAVAGSYRGWRGYLKRLFMLLAASFVFAGFMLFITLLSGGRAGIFQNGVYYFPISGTKLLVGCMAAYAGMTLYQKLFKRSMAAQESYRVFLSAQGKTVELWGEMDSQNRLIDLFSGTPVAVGPRALLEPILPEAVRSALAGDYTASAEAGGVRMIPCTTVAGAGLLPAFRPERMLLENGPERIEVTDVYIAVAAGQDGAGIKKLILNPALTGRKTQNFDTGRC
ncbi:MAG: sigma-E processing peptidase SpoIIGA [Provencibacterium sp.]|jgi:stage II sporulation protein GA (sporulation sigma-E factor processing peptidase)|nr:sigma-E processing peptidase SpoIIGA [Provencibacterium sp.]